jgi:hypothetical protein
VPKGLALHFGINAVDPDEYPPLTVLKGAENDARLMTDLSCSLNYRGISLTQPSALLPHPVPVVGPAVTRQTILDSIVLAASKMEHGDIVLISFAGHGGQVSNERPVTAENDGMDDYLCAFDGPVLDDELADRWQCFPEGVRIVVVVDACNSGTITEVPPGLHPDSKNGHAGHALRVRGLTPAQSKDVFARHRELFDREAALIPGEPRQPPSPIVLLAACDERGTTYDGDSQGAFTTNLMRVWNKGAFRGTHQRLIDEAGAGLVYPFKPVLHPVGRLTRAFDCQPAFRIDWPPVGGEESSNR